MRCRCCGKHIVNYNCINIFGDTAIKENIKDAIEKYGGITVRADETGQSSHTICKSCFILLKGINDRIRKFALLCHQNAEKSSDVRDDQVGKRTFQQHKSPASKTASPSVNLNRPKRIRPSTSPSYNSLTCGVQEQGNETDKPSETRLYRGSLLAKFSSTTTQPIDQSTLTSTTSKETRSHEILRHAGLQSAEVQYSTLYYYFEKKSTLDLFYTIQRTYYSA